MHNYRVLMKTKIIMSESLEGLCVTEECDLED